MDASFFNESLSANAPIGSEPVCVVNPATGLPMQNHAQVDIEGNPLDADLQDCWSDAYWPDEA